MPSEKVKKLDINQFVQDFTDSSVRNIPWFTRQFNLMVFDNNFNDYDGPRDDKELKANIEHYSPAGQRLYNQIYSLYTNPKSAESFEFAQFWQFISAIFQEHNPNQPQIMMILKKLSMFDEKTQFEILKQVIFNVNVPKTADMYFALAKNKYATSYYKIIAVRETKNLDLARDTFESLKKDLEQELKKPFSNADIIKGICQNAKMVMRVFPNGEDIAFSKETNTFFKPGPEDAYLLQMRDLFDFDKIVSFGAEYIPQYNNTLEQRVVLAERKANEAEAESANLQQRAEQNNSVMQNTNQQLQSDLSAQRKQNELLQKELNKLQAELESKNSFIKSIKMRMASLKMGMFGNGKEFQLWLNQELDKQTQK